MGKTTAAWTSTTSRTLHSIRAGGCEALVWVELCVDSGYISRLLSSIYDEIASNEIRMKDEMKVALPTAAPAGIAGALANVGRDLQKEAYMMQSSGMVNKTEVKQVDFDGTQ